MFLQSAYSWYTTCKQTKGELMPRRNHGRRARDDGSLRANKEQRDGRVLKVFRKVDQEDTARLIGAIADLVKSNDIPPATTTKKHIAYIIDPRLMPRNFNFGFMTGMQVQKFATLVERDEAIEAQVGYSVKLGKAALLQNNRRTVLVELNQINWLANVVMPLQLLLVLVLQALQVLVHAVVTVTLTVLEYLLQP